MPNELDSYHPEDSETCAVDDHRVVAASLCRVVICWVFLGGSRSEFRASCIGQGCVVV